MTNFVQNITTYFCFVSIKFLLLDLFQHMLLFFPYTSHDVPLLFNKIYLLAIKKVYSRAPIWANDDNDWFFLTLSYRGCYFSTIQMFFSFFVSVQITHVHFCVVALIDSSSSFFPCSHKALPLSLLYFNHVVFWWCYFSPSSRYLWCL